MGTVADDIIDGLACQECGIYIGGGDGYPRTCDDCNRRPSRSSGEKPSRKRAKKCVASLAPPLAWSDYQRQALQTAAGSATPDLDHAVLGIAGEAGEIVDALKKHRVYGQPLNTQNVVEELGDLAWYIALACRALDVSFDDCLKANLRKLAKRYPDGKWDAEHCATRDHEAEAAALNG